MINYVKTNWVNNSAPAINANNLNKIENGIKQTADAVDSELLTTAEYNDIAQRLGI